MSDDPLDQAEAELVQGDAHRAFTTLRPLLFDEALAGESARFVEVLTLFARVGAALAGEEFGAKVRAAAERPDDIRALYDLGYDLIEQGLPAAAVTVLTRANALHPGQEAVVTELVAALERDMRYGAARAVLLGERGLLLDSFMCRYLLVFNSLMSGDLVGARAGLDTLRPGPEPGEQVMAARVTRMVARCEAVAGLTPLDGRDLRGWHLGLTGGLLLHRSPHGEESMAGRYAFVQDNEELCAAGVRLAEAAAAALGQRPPQVFAPADRDSAILAHAAALILGLPLVPWPTEGSTKPGLIVVYDLDNLDSQTLATLLERRPGQLLWAHASCWTHDLSITADLTTFLYQHCRSPWGEQLRFTPERHETYTHPADTAPVEQIAARVAAATPDADALADQEELVALVRRVAPLLPPDGQRERQWAGSPVPSARFL
ncbi:MAG TPA: hypothetical protein VFS21_24450 [Roseiflexaceae bacterium]|nr:hypothetical protein [Roseiflexaceae bacterium]